MKHYTKNLKKRKITRKKNKKNRSKKRGGAEMKKPYDPSNSFRVEPPAPPEPRTANQLMDYFNSILDFLRSTKRPNIIDSLLESDEVYITAYHLNMHGSEIPEDIPEDRLSRYFMCPFSNLYTRGCLLGGAATAGGWDPVPLMRETMGTVKWMSMDKHPIDNIHNRGQPQREFLLEMELGYTEQGTALSGILVTPKIHIGKYNPITNSYDIPEVRGVTRSTFTNLPIDFRPLGKSSYYKLSDILQLIGKDILSKDYGTRLGNTVHLPIILITHCSSSIPNAQPLSSNPSGQKGAHESFSPFTLGLFESAMQSSKNHLSTGSASFSGTSQSQVGTPPSSSEWGGSSFSGSGTSQSQADTRPSSSEWGGSSFSGSGTSQSQTDTRPSSSEWGGSSFSGSGTSQSQTTGFQSQSKKTGRVTLSNKRTNRQPKPY